MILTVLFRWVAKEKSSTIFDGKPLLSSPRIFRTLGEKKNNLVELGKYDKKIKKEKMYCTVIYTLQRT